MLCNMSKVVSSGVEVARKGSQVVRGYSDSPSLLATGIDTWNGPRGRGGQGRANRSIGVRSELIGAEGLTLTQPNFAPYFLSLLETFQL